MGTGASASPAVGVPINPRIEYTANRVKKSGKSFLRIDAPVLVDLGPGTVRFRDDRGGTDGAVRSEEGGDRIEKPHVGGDDLNSKKGYFYHAKMKDYSFDGLRLGEEHNFKYVINGPVSSKSKHLYYVTGKGNIPTGSLQSSTFDMMSPVGELPELTGGDNRRKAFEIIPLRAELSLTEEEIAHEEAGDVSVAQESLDGRQTSVSLHVATLDTVSKVKERLSMRLLTPPNSIDIISGGKRLYDNVELKELLDFGTAKYFKVILRSRPDPAV